jgi:hypothetical protein
MRRRAPARAPAANFKPFGPAMIVAFDDSVNRIGAG